MKKIFKKIKSKIIDFHYSVKEGVPNLIRYAPLIWKDKNFDEEFMYKMLQFKLKRMVKFFNGDHAMTLTAPEKAKEIQEVVDLLERIIKDDYHDNEVDIDEFIKFEKVSIGGNSYTTMTFDKKNENYKIWSKQTEDADDQRIQDLTKAFKIIGDKSPGWWD